MKLGICAGPDGLADAAAAGFDFTTIKPIEFDGFRKQAAITCTTGGDRE